MSSSDGTGSSSLVKGGPATQEGKEVVRWNATRHGISSPAPVVPGLERSADWEEHHDGMLASLRPEGHLETELAERVALLSWRLHRVTRYETAAIATSQERVKEDVHLDLRFLFSLQGSLHAASHPEDIRFEAKDSKRIYNALKRFPSLDPARILKGEDASSVVWSVLMAAQRAKGEEISVEDLHLRGVPEGAWVGELPDMKQEDVKDCLKSIAQVADEAPEDLLETTTERARQISILSKMKAEQTGIAIDVMRRERSLPDGKTLEKIARYEAHLSRQLYHALHELENLQKRRKMGEGTPLARLDVQGIPDT
jgi:hypothetical protein